MTSKPRRANGRELGDGDRLRNDDFARAGRRRCLLLAMGAVQLAAERGDRAHALFVARQRARDGELAGAPSAWRRLAGSRRLDGGLAALLGADFFLFLGEIATPLGRERCRGDGAWRCRDFFLLFEAASGLC